MKIAILGGNFDPPHIGHLLVTQQVTKRLNIDQMWLLPFANHFSQEPVASPKYRSTMVTFLEDSTSKVSLFAIKKPSTFDPMSLLEELTKIYPQHSFYWIIGSTQIKKYAAWEHGEKFFRHYKIIIYSCGEEKEIIEDAYKQAMHQTIIPNNIFILASKDIPCIDISSETIRGKVRQKQSIRGLVPRKVEEYILEHKLYV